MILSVVQIPQRIKESLSTLGQPSEVSEVAISSALQRLGAYESALGISSLPNATIESRINGVIRAAEQVVIQELPAPLSHEQRPQLSLEALQLQVTSLQNVLDKIRTLQSILNGEPIGGQITDANPYSQRSFIQNARLCRLDLSCLPTNAEVSMNLKDGSAGSAAICRFVPSAEDADRYTVHVNLPPNKQVLSLVVADLGRAWGNPSDGTITGVHTGWSNRGPSSSRGLPYLSAPGREPGSEIIREHNGDTWDLNVSIGQPWSVRIVSLARTGERVFPKPILLRGLTTKGDLAAEEVHVIKESGQDLLNVFPACNERVAWLEVAPLSLNDAYRLSPDQVEELLGGINHVVCPLVPSPDKTGEYTVDLSEPTVKGRLENVDSVLALQIADVALPNL
jgi:hypothetical protein